MMIRQSIFFSSIVINIVAALFFCQWFNERLVGKHYDLASKRDLGELRRIIYSFEPVLSALEKYHQQHARYPETLDALTLKQRHYHEEMIKLDDSPTPINFALESTVKYRLYIKLGLDNALRYYSDDNVWYYDPGDGSEEHIIEP